MDIGFWSIVAIVIITGIVLGLVLFPRPFTPIFRRVSSFLWFVLSSKYLWWTVFSLFVSVFLLFFVIKPAVAFTKSWWNSWGCQDARYCFRISDQKQVKPEASLASGEDIVDGAAKIAGSTSKQFAAGLPKAASSAAAAQSAAPKASAPATSLPKPQGLPGEVNLEGKPARLPSAQPPKSAASSGGGNGVVIPPTFVNGSECDPEKTRRAIARLGRSTHEDGQPICVGRRIG